MKHVTNSEGDEDISVDKLSMHGSGTRTGLLQ